MASRFPAGEYTERRGKTKGEREVRLPAPERAASERREAELGPLYDRSAKLAAKGVVIEYWLQRSRSLFTAVKGVDLEVRPGELLAIVGPSGCGKTTFLNAVDGLIPIASGSLLLDGNEISSPGPDRAMVFQQPSLLPWRTVTRNVVYGLEMQHRAGRESRETAARLIDRVGRQGFADAWPSELSGGLPQRANLGPALRKSPREQRPSR